MSSLSRRVLAGFALLTVAVGSLAANPVPPGQGERFPPRVLLAGSAAGRDYQFVRTFLYRELLAKRMSGLSVYLQGQRQVGNPADQDPMLELKHFPDRLETPKEKEQPDPKENLASYDVIVAFDLDWSKLDAKQIDALVKWTQAGGGLIVLAGPVHTMQLAPTFRLEAGKAIRELLPLVPEDIRLLALERETEQPRRLRFPDVGEQGAFLKLDPDSKKPAGGWDEFFTGKKEPKEKDELERGFYACYPVKEVKKDAVVLASFVEPDPKQPGKEMTTPYLVTQKVGKGRVVWVGSSELWRLRTWHQAAHERLWTGLINHARGR
jgi:hypothetical protein